MPYNIILCYIVVFMSLIVFYFLHSTSVLSFYINVVLALSIIYGHGNIGIGDAKIICEVLRNVCLNGVDVSVHLLLAL